MAVPRNRSSHSKKGSRRAHHMKKTINFKTCTSCSNLTVPHRICPSCGTYDQKQVVSMAAE